MNPSVFISLGLLLPTATFAQQFEKATFPCIAELCIGDGLPELSRIQWDRAKLAFSGPDNEPIYVDTTRVPDLELKLLQETYRGAVGLVVEYLQAEAFDQKALRLLQTVTADCGTHQLVGTYTSQGGNPTAVKVSLMPLENETASQHWVVVSISRSYPDALTQAQRADIQKQLQPRYRRFDLAYGIPRGVDGSFSINPSGASAAFGFSLVLMSKPNELERRLQHPQCGGSKKISVD
jgi:hypothetical protein